MTKQSLYMPYKFKHNITCIFHTTYSATSYGVLGFWG